MKEIKKRFLLFKPMSVCKLVFFVLSDFTVSFPTRDYQYMLIIMSKKENGLVGLRHLSTNYT